jgi:transposase InsO family protein
MHVIIHTQFAVIFTLLPEFPEKQKLEYYQDNQNNHSNGASDLFFSALCHIQQFIVGCKSIKNRVTYDNARMESFFAILKKELLCRIPTYKMKRDEVKSIIFRYVFTYYNQMRIYTANPYGLPPAACRKLLEDQQLLAA